MELTQQDKNVLVSVLKQLSFPAEKAEEAVYIKGLITKLSQPEEKKEEPKQEGGE